MSPCAAEALSVSGGLNVDELADMLDVTIEDGPYEAVGEEPGAP